MRQPDRAKRTGDALRAGDVHARQGAPGVEGIRTSAIAWLLLSLAVLLLEQATKWWAMTAIPDAATIADAARAMFSGFPPCRFFTMISETASAIDSPRAEKPRA